MTRIHITVNFYRSTTNTPLLIIKPLAIASETVPRNALQSDEIVCFNDTLACTHASTCVWTLLFNHVKYAKLYFVIADPKDVWTYVTKLVL